jgi:antitoxin MazE
MITHIQKWGNSLALRIPKALASELSLGPDSAVEITQEHGQIVVTPVGNPVFRLEELLDQVTTENLHAKVDTGSAVGNEVW